VLDKVHYFKDRIKKSPYRHFERVCILASPRYFKYLEEAAPEDGDPAGSIEAHELEDIT